MEKPCIVGVGGANVDLCGRSFGPILPGDSNPGQLTLSAGGVCRNICENVCRMGAPAALITVFGEDANGAFLKDACQRAGLDLSPAFTLPGMRTGAYLSIHSGDGEMVTAVNDMEILAAMTPALLERRAHTLEQASAIVLDANLPEETLRWLCQRFSRRPLFADTVSCAKAKRLLPSLPMLYALKPNLAEARLLTGRETPEDCAAALRERGVSRVFLSAGSRGVYTASPEGCFWTRPRPLTRAENATGAGDSLLAGLLFAHASGMALREALRFAVTASVLTLQSRATIRPDLSCQLILNHQKECVLE